MTRTFILLLTAWSLGTGAILAGPSVQAADGKVSSNSPADHSQIDHSQMQHDSQTMTAPAADHSQHDSGSMDHSQHGVGAMDHGSMQGGTAPPDARDPNAYAEGLRFDKDRLHVMDEHAFAGFLADRLEATHNRDHTGLAYDFRASYGRAYDRLVLKAEGDADDGRLEEARTELLWSHAIAAYWDFQTGMRADHGAGPDRNWLAIGVQGLAPYWFEVDATAYASDQGYAALRLDLEYELLLTQRLIVQPRLEANFYGKADSERGLGTGLSDVVAGIRLRYEIRRQFAPYIGIERASWHGGTADARRTEGHDTRETRYVAGFRVWY